MSYGKNSEFWTQRKLWIALVGLVLIWACYFIGRWYFTKSSTPLLNTVTVERGTIEKTVTALGSLQPKDYVDVGTQVSGQLKKVHVEIGDRVEKDQLIAEIDPKVYETQVRTGEANIEKLSAQLAQREAEVKLAKQQLTRNQRLLAAKAVSEYTVEENQASLIVAEAQIISLRAEIKAAKSALEGYVTNLSYTKIHSPMAGTVVSESALEGQTVNASQSAPIIVKVADLDTMTVWAEVAEADIVKIRPEMSSYFTTLGMPQKRWYGVVRQIQPTPQIVNDVVLYNVLIDVDNSNHLLMTDMTVQVFFLLAEAKDVVLAPLSALQIAGDNYRARVLTDDGVQPRKLTVGLANRTSVEVKSGLEIGEKLVVNTMPLRAVNAERGRPMPPGPRL